MMGPTLGSRELRRGRDSMPDSVGLSAHSASHLDNADGESVWYSALASFLVSTDGQPRASEALDWLHPGMELGDCLLLRELGHGSFSRVFLADHPQTRLLAIKIATRASCEPRLLANLRHPGIASVFHSSRDDGSGLSLLLMEYVPGETLQASIVELREGREPAWIANLRVDEIEGWHAVVARLGASIADALSYAHGNGVVHRDVKPSNVLIDDTGGTKLIDFNVSFDARQTARDSRADFGGSRGYMSPEQRGVFAATRKPDDVTAATDVYSLGVMLRELLDARGQPCKSSIDEQPLRRLLDRCTEIDPRHRPTMQMVCRELRLLSNTKVCDWLFAVERQTSHRVSRRGHSSNSIGLIDVIAHLSWVMVLTVLPTLCWVVAFLIHARLYWEPMEEWGKPFVYVQEWFYSISVPFGFSWLAIRHVNRCLGRTGWLLTSQNPREDSLPSKQQGADTGLTKSLPALLNSGVACCVVLIAGWVLVGVTFPLVNNWFGGGKLGLAQWLPFACRATLYGLLSIPATLHVATWLALRYLVPFAVHEDSVRKRLVVEGLTVKNAGGDVTVLRRLKGMVEQGVLVFSVLLLLAFAAELGWTQGMQEIRFGMGFILVSLIGIAQLLAMAVLRKRIADRTLLLAEVLSISDSVMRPSATIPQDLRATTCVPT